VQVRKAGWVCAVGRPRWRCAGHSSASDTAKTWYHTVNLHHAALPALLLTAQEWSTPVLCQRMWQAICSNRLPAAVQDRVLATDC
jgi:hypothetical protein